MKNTFLNRSNYHKERSLYSLTIVLCTLFLFLFSMVTVHADDQESMTLETTILDLENLPSDVPIEETLTVLNENRLETIADETLQPTIAEQRLSGTTVIGANVIRMSGTTCQLYLSWAGTDSINAWRANNIKATNLNLIGPVTYLSTNNFYSSTTASSVGTTYVGTMSIPTKEKEAKVSVSNLQAYYLLHGWRSGIIKNGLVVIN